MCLNWKRAEVSWLVEWVRYRQICEPLLAFEQFLHSHCPFWTVLLLKKNSLPLVKCGYQAPQKSPVCATCVKLNGPPGCTAVMCLGVVLHSSNSLHLAVAVDYGTWILVTLALFTLQPRMWFLSYLDWWKSDFMLQKKCNFSKKHSNHPWRWFKISFEF